MVSAQDWCKVYSKSQASATQDYTHHKDKIL